tara:strand:- start:860 stop:1096 length:237 start_codon:yes stop_codon:yes gene_type:complete
MHFKILKCLAKIILLYLNLIFKNRMDYIKKSLQSLSEDNTYEEIDTRLASGWYVDTKENNKKKKFKTSKVSFKISKKR